LIPQISDSGDNLPSGRQPGTELMHQMLQKGGSAGGYDAREDLKKWMVGLSPNSQGRLMYHIADAAEVHAVGIGASGRMSGMEFMVVGLNLQWESAKDSHWEEAGRSIENKIGGELDKKEQTKAAYHDGFDQADKRPRKAGAAE
jgi:hypothetical protein